MTVYTMTHAAPPRVPLLQDLGRLDWDRLEETSVIAERVLRKFAADKRLFNELLDRVPSNPELWAKCEEDLVEDKIVLWDDIDNGVRIRLRMSTAPQQRLAHNHRFSFSNLVLRGSYVHWGYVAPKGFGKDTLPEEVETVLLHEDRVGDCFTIHHDTLHSTPFTEVGTVSLVLRGNPVKRRAPVMFKEPRDRDDALKYLATASQSDEVEPAKARTGDFFWRVGEELESVERRRERQMSLDRFAYWRKTLRDWDLI